MKDTDYFVAISKDNPHSENGFYYSVYLINNTDKHLEKVETSSYGFVTMGEDLIKTSSPTHEFYDISPYNFIQLEEADEGSWDFVVVYSISIKSDASLPLTEHTFNISKGLAGLSYQVNIPVIGKDGFVVLPE